MRIASVLKIALSGELGHETSSRPHTKSLAASRQRAFNVFSLGDVVGKGETIWRRNGVDEPASRAFRVLSGERAGVAQTNASAYLTSRRVESSSSPLLLQLQPTTASRLVDCNALQLRANLLHPMSSSRIVTRLAPSSDLQLQLQTRIRPPSMLSDTSLPHATAKLLSLFPEHLQTKHPAFPTVFWSQSPDGNLAQNLTLSICRF